MQHLNLVFETDSQNETIVSAPQLTLEQIHEAIRNYFGNPNVKIKIDNFGFWEVNHLGTTYILTISDE